MVKMFCRCILLFLLLILFSCSDGNLFLSPPAAVELETLSSGTIVTLENPDVSHKIIKNTEDVIVQSLKIELLDPYGATVAFQVLEGDVLLNPLPPLSLEGIPPGTYTLRYTVNNEKLETLLDKEATFFLVESVYKIQGVSVFPPVLYPGGSGVMVANVQMPPGADPYLRWSVGDSLLFEGLLSAGFDSIVWNAPEKEGVYNLKVEMFPYAPVFNRGFSFQSSEELRTSLFVTKNQETSKHEFTPDKYYYSLFHFRGETRDYGTRENKNPLSVIGEPTLDVRGNLFGYYLKENSGFSTEQILLPTDQGRLLPFSLQFRLGVDFTSGKGILFHTESPESGFVLTLYTEEDGFYKLSLTSPTDSLVFDSSVPSATTDLAVTLIPQDRYLTVKWYAEGINTGNDETEHLREPIQVSPQGRTVLGGEGGLQALVDEFGVFFREEEGFPFYNTDLYYQAMKKEHGANLYLAEGFDGAPLSDLLSLNNDSMISNSSLVLPPESSLSLRIALPESEEFNLYATGVSGKGSMYLFLEDSTEALLELPWEYPEEGSMEFLLFAENNQLTLSKSGESFSLPFPGKGTRDLVLVFQNTGDAGMAKIKDLLVLRQGIKVSRIDQDSSSYL